MVGDEVQDIIGNCVFEVIDLRLLPENRDAVLEVGLRDVGDHPPLKATDEAGLEAGNFRGWAIAGEDDLPARFVHGVEGVKELFLCRFLAAEEVDVVDEEQVRLAVAATEIVHRATGNRRDDIVRELLGTDVHHPAGGIAAQDFVRDGLHEVGFA